MAANPRRGEVDVELDGRTYVLVFNFEAISQIEAAFGDRPIDEIFFSGAISRRALVEAIRAGLEKKNRKHTSRQVAAMLDATVDKGGADAMAAIMRAVIRGLLSANGATQEKIDELDQILDAEAKAASSGEQRGVDDAPPPRAPETGTV